MAMFLKKVEGRRAVTLRDGTVFSQADLPPQNTRRWVASRKALVVMAVSSGLLRRDEALEIYALTEEEYHEWETAVARHGVDALKTTALQRYRQP